MEELAEQNIKFMNPFMAFTDEQVLTKQLVKVFKKEFRDSRRAKSAAAAKQGMGGAARISRDGYRKEGRGGHRPTWRRPDKRGIVLAGRPYHVDPEINHGIPELITSYGFAVLTEDSVSHLGKVERPLIVTDQWMYHSRLYAAANLCEDREITWI